MMMSSQTKQRFPTAEVTPNFIPKDDQSNPEFARLEAERLWPYVWQIACRLEEIPDIGNFVTYDIMDESIIVVRSSETEITACPQVVPQRVRHIPEGWGGAQRYNT